jgi:CRP-like cAMP-binding protein
MAKIKPLKQNRIFSSLSDRELALFSRLISEEDYIPGTVLLAQNMKSDRFFLVERGRVSVSTGSDIGPEELVLEDGDTFGEWSLIAPPHLTQVTARVLESAQVLVLAREDFNRFSEEEPGIALKIVKGILTSLWPTIQDVGKSLKEAL